MENDKTIENSHESLEIITQMIQKTKLNIQQGSFHLLLWGWIIIAGSLGQFLFMKYTSILHVELAWLVIIPGVFISMIYGIVKGRRARVHTYADYLTMWIWLGFLFTSVVMMVVVLNVLSQFNQYQLIGAMFLLLAGYATFLAGITIKFRPLIIGGCLFWIFSLVGYFIGGAFSLLISAVAVVCGYLIPGYMLKNRSIDG